MTCRPVCPGLLLRLSKGIDRPLRAPLASLHILVAHPQCLTRSRLSPLVHGVGLLVMCVRGRKCLGVTGSERESKDCQLDPGQEGGQLMNNSNSMTTHLTSNHGQYNYSLFSYIEYKKVRFVLQLNQSA